MFPAAHETKNRNQRGIENKHVAPDGLSPPVGNIQRNEIHTAGGRIALEGDNRHDAVQKSPENHIEQNIVKQGLKIQHPQKEAGKKYLHEREKRKPPADAFAAQYRHRNV